MGAPAGSPYQDLVLTGDRGYLSPVLDTLLIGALWITLMVAATLVVDAVAAMSGIEMGDSFLPADPVWSLVVMLGSIATALPAARLAARWVQSRSPGTLSSVAGRLRWRWLLVCAGWAAPFLALNVLLGLPWGPSLDPSRWPGWGTYAATVGVILLLVPLQAAAEEYLFRGFLLQSLCGPRRPVWLVAVVTSAVFSAAHAPMDLVVAIDLALIGLVACWVTVATGGLEAAIGLHVVNNLVALSIGAAEGTIEWSDSATESVGTLAVSAITMIGYGWWITRVARRRRIATRTGDAGSLTVA